MVIANILTIRRRKARAEATTSFAALHGFRSEGDTNPFLGLEAHRPLPAGRVGIAPIVPQVLLNLAAGHGSIRNVLRGPTAAGEVTVFDYSPPVAESSSDTPLFATFAAFQVPGIPELVLMRRPLFTIGIKVIDFPSHSRFSKRFSLMANDEAAVRRLFSDAVLDACEALSEKREWQFQGGSQWLLASFGLARHEELTRLVAETARVAAAMR